VSSGPEVDLIAGRTVVGTTGTASGKTECYLLPVFAYLVEELMQGWGTPNPPPARPCGGGRRIKRGFRSADMKRGRGRAQFAL
jgi:hypothetical protein